MSRLLPALWLLALVLGCSGRGESTAPLAASPPAVPEEESVPFPFPVVELAGSSAELGAEHGRVLGGAIRALHDKYFRSYFQSEGQRLLALGAASAFESRLLPHHREEVRALASETMMDGRQMMLAQCFLDLSAMTACSTVALPASAAPDGVARFGRNLDFPSFDIADQQTVVLVYRPEGRNAFIAVSWPGLVGVLSGMNEHGLTLANMEVRRGLRLPEAMPYPLLYRTVLEQCRTTEEAIELLERTPRQTANNLMVMDAAGGRAVVEITPQSVRVRRGVDGESLFSTNHQRGQDADALGHCDRYDCLHDAAKRAYGKIDRAALRGMLREASQGDMTLQSIIFEPSNRVMYLSAGKDAARGTFYELDLKPHFEKKGSEGGAP